MTALPPRKRPQQARSQATVEAILQAAAHILTGDTAQALTTGLVAERAGVSIGSLYQYFPNKEAILVELIRRKRARLVVALSLALAEAGGAAGGAARLTAVIAASVAVQLPWARLARALDEAEAFLPLGAETVEFRAEVQALIAQAISPASATEVGDVIALSAGLIEAAGLNGETDAEALTARVERAVKGYLGRAA